MTRLLLAIALRALYAIALILLVIAAVIESASDLIAGIGDRLRKKARPRST